MIHHLRALAARLRGLFGHRRAEQELDDEIEMRLRLLTERYVRQGMTEEEAAWAARRRFGNVTLLKEEHSEMHGIRLINTLFQDLRYGMRMLLKSPALRRLRYSHLRLASARTRRSSASSMSCSSSPCLTPVQNG